MWKKNLVDLLISRYKKHENLYNVRHPQYTDRVKRAKSLLEICKELQDKNKHITVEEIKKKIHSLRSQYVRELRDINNSKLSGIGADDVIEPKFWCFSQLEFLTPHCGARKSVSTVTHMSEESSSTLEEDDTSVYINENETEPHLVAKPDLEAKPNVVQIRRFKNVSSMKLRQKNKDTEEEDLDAVVVDAFKDSGVKLTALAQGWCSQYAELSRQQKVLARKIISDVLFHGCLDNLTEIGVHEINNIFECKEAKSYDDPLN